MSLHQGLDLSRFKKVSSDKKTSTLRHAKGHEIKIAHESVSPKMRDVIAAMPVYMAEGGEAQGDGYYDTEKGWQGAQPADAQAEDHPLADETDETDETAEPDDGAGEEEAEPAAQPEGEESPAAAPPAEDTSAAMPPKSDSVPESNTIEVNGARPPRTADELHAENAQIAQDIALGHIKPKTMQDLYDSKDTLGKIGTLFGLLVSGMGSGLTGQPNAVLEMMNQTIKNDLEAQIKSGEGARNWYQMSLQHEMNRANIKRLAVENEYTRAKTGQVPAETERIKAATTAEKARARHENASAELVAKNSAIAGMRLGVLKDLNDKVDDMSPGSQKAAAGEMLNTQVAPAINAENEKDTNETAEKIKLSAAIHGQPQPGADRVDMSKIRKMALLGGAQSSIAGFNSKGFAPGQGDKAAAEGAMVNGNRDRYDILRKSWEDLDRHAFGGKINEGYYNTKMNEMVQALHGTGLTEKESYDIAHSSLPGPKDWGETRQEKAKHMHDVFMLNERGKTPTLSQVGMVPAFPPPPKVSKSIADQGTVDKVVGGAKKIADKLLKGGPEAQGSEGETKVMHGSTYRKVKGGWQKVK